MCVVSRFLTTKKMMIIFEFVFNRSDNTPLAFCYFLAFIVFFAAAWRNKDV